MQSATTTETLRQVPLFSGLAEEQLAWFFGEGTEMCLAPGRKIASQGDPADGFYVILEGYRIVVGQHGGDIRVVSEPGDTRFQVRLPLEPDRGIGRSAQPVQATREEIPR